MVKILLWDKQNWPQPLITIRWVCLCDQHFCEWKQDIVIYAHPIIASRVYSVGRILIQCLPTVRQGRCLREATALSSHKHIVSTLLQLCFFRVEYIAMVTLQYGAVITGNRSKPLTVD